MNKIDRVYLLAAGSVCSVLLLAAPLPLPYGYYRMLRVFVLVGSVILALDAQSRDQKISVIVLSSIAIVFNPFVPLGFTREVWAPLNWISAAVFAHVTYRIFRRQTS